MHIIMAETANGKVSVETEGDRKLVLALEDLSLIHI